MNNELERVGYDNWKLSNRDDEIARSQKHTFVMKKNLGVCPCCASNVYDNQLFVEDQEEVFHFSCYNNKKANEVSE